MYHMALTVLYVALTVLYVCGGDLVVGHHGAARHHVSENRLHLRVRHRLLQALALGFTEVPRL